MATPRLIVPEKGDEGLSGTRSKPNPVKDNYNYEEEEGGDGDDPSGTTEDTSDDLRELIVRGYSHIRTLDDLIKIVIDSSSTSLDEGGAAEGQQSALPGLMEPQNFDYAEAATLYQSIYRITSRVISVGLEDELGIGESQNLKFLVKFEQRFTKFKDSLYEYMIVNAKSLRVYKTKLGDGKWCFYTCMYSCMYQLIVIQKVLHDRIVWFDQKGEYMKVVPGIAQRSTELNIEKNYMLPNCLLLYAKRSLLDLNQMELWKQLLVIRHNWYNLPYSEKYTKLMIKKLEYACAIMVVTNDPNGRVINGKEGEFRKTITLRKMPSGKPGGPAPGTPTEAPITVTSYACSAIFYDNLSCIFEDLHYSLWMRDKLYNNPISLELQLESTNNDPRQYVFKEGSSHLFNNKGNQKEKDKIIPKMNEWLENESQLIGDDAFKDRIKLACVNMLLRPGELEIYIRDVGVKPTNAIIILEKYRPSLQVGWWMTKSLSVGIGIKLDQYNRNIRSIIASTIFNAFCESHPKMRFAWGQECMIFEGRFAQSWVHILTTHEPTIIQYMGSYVVLYRGTLWEVKGGIEEAIMVWLRVFIKAHDDTYAFHTKIHIPLDEDESDNNNDMITGKTEFKGEKESYDVAPLLKFIESNVMLSKNKIIKNRATEIAKVLTNDNSNSFVFVPMNNENDDD